MGGRSSGPDAMFKLGGTPLAPAGEPLAADLGTSEGDLAVVFLAVSERRHLVFDYRGRERVVAPFGLAHRRGHWYLIGPERADSVVKLYRLDRAAPVRVTGPARRVRPTRGLLRRRLRARRTRGRRAPTRRPRRWYASTPIWLGGRSARSTTRRR